MLSTAEALRAARRMWSPPEEQTAIPGDSTDQSGSSNEGELPTNLDPDIIRSGRVTMSRTRAAGRRAPGSELCRSSGSRPGRSSPSTWM